MPVKDEKVLDRLRAVAEWLAKSKAYSRQNLGEELLEMVESGGGRSLYLRVSILKRGVVVRSVVSTLWKHDVRALRAACKANGFTYKLS